MPEPTADELIRNMVMSDTPNGYRTFYEFLHNRPLPDHGWAWIKAAYAARATGDGIMVKGFRGSTKTTIFTNTLMAYKIGLYPRKTRMLIQASDESAQDNTALVKATIEHNPIWKYFFPNVVPDSKAKWGAEGYDVLDTNVDYGEGTRAKTKDPSFVGYGIHSSVSVGRHPSGELYIDDIHDEKNTVSDKEINRIKRELYANVMPCRTPNYPWMVVSYTPWTSNDSYTVLEGSGEYAMLSTPVYEECTELVEGAVWYPEIEKWVKLAWPEGMPLERIEQERRMGLSYDGGLEYARMYLLDLAAANNRIIAYSNYPEKEVDISWPTTGGVDYASVFDESARGQAGQSHFALAYVSELPEGGLVVVDGVPEQCSQVEAENYVYRGQMSFPQWRTVAIESDGKGGDFIQTIARRADIMYAPHPSRELGNMSKPDRHRKHLGAWMGNGRVKISTKRSKFLDNLRNYCNAFPNVGKTHPGADAADAVYVALLELQHHLFLPKPASELPASRFYDTNKQRQRSPWAKLG